MHLLDVDAAMGVVVKVESATLDPAALDPSFDFVFRDFERSKLGQIRELLAADNGTYSLIYFAIVVFWTVAMSYGAIMHGHSGFAVNLAPHVAFYTLIIGVMLYPARRVWIPLAAFSTVYFIPFLLTHSDGTTWIELGANAPGLIGAIYVYHIITGGAIAVVSQRVALKLQSLAPPYSIDLLYVVTLYFAFLLFCGLQAWVFWQAAQTLPTDLRLQLGFGPDYMAATVERVLRGGIVASGFLLGIFEVSSRRALILGSLASSAFLALAMVHSAGLELHQTLDVCLLALLLITILPNKIAMTSCIIGIPIYSALTGAFVSTGHLGDPLQTKLEYLSIAMLTIIVLAPTVRAHTLHQLRQREAAMRRLSMVRDFANVGLLSFNLCRQAFRTDASVQRILSTKPLGSVDEFAALFDAKDQADLRLALSGQAEGSVNLLLSRPLDGQVQVLRICLWFETAPSGEKVAYGLVLDVTGEHDKERALEATLAELSLRQERQRQLFSIVSHELRTPASVVSMLIDDLPARHVPAKLRKQLREAIDQLLSTLADMRQTVNPAQNLPVTRTAYSPAELADSVRNMFAQTAREAGMAIYLTLSDAARLPRFGDQMRLRQALSNMLRNAIIHSKGSAVTLRFDAVMAGGQTISRWTITDNGVGIPEGQVERLFQAFERGAQDPNNPVDGSGLGLFIARSSIEILGGTITNFAPAGGGTGFVIEVPEDIVADQALPPPPAALIAKKQARYPNIYVLLAEDNALVAEVTLAKLSRFVGRVELACNGAEALAKIAVDPPDLLITDLFMPEMAGDVLTAALRAAGNPLPIIGLTAAAVGDDINRFEDAGATAVMVKPLDIPAIREVIEDINQRKTKRPARTKSKAA
jgi:two-component system, sensor histidine kinase